MPANFKQQQSLILSSHYLNREQEELRAQHQHSAGQLLQQ